MRGDAAPWRTEAAIGAPQRWPRCARLASTAAPDPRRRLPAARCMPRRCARIPAPAPRRSSRDRRAAGPRFARSQTRGCRRRVRGYCRRRRAPRSRTRAHARSVAPSAVARMRGRSPERCQAVTVSTTVVGDTSSSFAARCASMAAGVLLVGGRRRGISCKAAARIIRVRCARAAAFASPFSASWLTGQSCSSAIRTGMRRRTCANREIRRTVGELLGERLREPGGQPLGHLVDEPPRLRAPAPAAMAHDTQPAVSDADRVHVRTRFPDRWP